MNSWGWLEKVCQNKIKIQPQLGFGTQKKAKVL
jgi:hypothetical protein